MIFLQVIHSTSHVFAQEMMVLRSMLILIPVRRGSSTISQSVVSSSSSRMFVHISFTISLMYMMKSNDPKIEPCGTPALDVFHDKA